MLHTLDATFLHLWIAAYVCVGELPALDEENLHTKQNNRNSHQNYGQKQYLHDVIIKKVCKFKKGF